MTMSDTDQAAQSRQDAMTADGIPRGGLLALSPFQRRFTATRPDLREELRFQTFALLMVPLAFGIAIYRVSISLLGYTPLHAVLFAGLAALALFTLDRHYLIQARGNPANEVRRAMLKVRVFSVAVISLAFTLMVTDTFRSDVEGVLAQARQERRAELERSPRYQAEIDAARAAVSQAQQAAERADALSARIAELHLQRSRELKAMTDEIQGNITNGIGHQEGYGPKARGHESAAEQLGRDIETTRAQLGALGDVSARLNAAKVRLAEVDARIDAETELAYGGKTQRLEALVPLLQNSLTAWVTIGFWLLIGLLPDLLMFAAQRQMFNHDAFVAMRAAEREDLMAEVARQRRELRQRHTERLTPIDVRIAKLVTTADPSVSPNNADAAPAASSDMAESRA